MVHAFVDFIQKEAGDEYQFTLRETETQNILEDLTNYKSEIGVLYLNDFNRKVMEKIIQRKELSIYATLYSETTRVLKYAKSTCRKREHYSRRTRRLPLFVI